MLYTTLEGRTRDLVQGLSQGERHVLQKALAWECLGLEPGEFKSRLARALLEGWNREGPVRESPLFREITADLERRLKACRGLLPGPDWLRPQLYQGAYGGGGLVPGERREGGMSFTLRDALGRDRGEVVLPLEEGAEPEAALARRAEVAGAVKALGLRLRD